jgi:hypothetical protein
MPVVIESEKEPGNMGMKWGIALATLLVAGWAFSAWIFSQEYDRRAVREKFFSPTAVGDSRYYVPPGPSALDAPAVSVAGQPLFLQATTPSNASEAGLFAVAETDDGQWTLYTLEEYKALPVEQINVFYLKAGPGSFFRLTREARSSK